jgi:hypothetical protein
LATKSRYLRHAKAQACAAAAVIVSGIKAVCADWSRMSLKFSLSIAIFLSLLPAVAFAAPYLGKRHAFHWYGYGFLPGYHQPPDNSLPIYTAKRSSHSIPAYTPSYWYNGGRYYFGEPGFYRGRYNGGSFGPCWTWTPIGLMWNCG